MSVSASLSMYRASAPVLTRALSNLQNLLGKAVAHVEARKLDPDALFGFRLFPDMLPLSRQVQIATDIAKGSVARLAGVEPPKYEDSEKTFAELIARVEKTIAYIDSFKPEQIDGGERREIVLKSPRGEMHFDGEGYLLKFVLPNVFFHVTTTYSIFRHNGVELGKADFLGALGS